MIVGRRLAWLALVSGPACALVLVGACSSSPSSGVLAPASGNDASVPADGGLVGDATSDASTSDAPAGACEGACKTTTLVADFGGKKRTLTRAQFGTQPGDAGLELHTESYLGGDPACPSMTSPTTDYTLIVSSIPRGVAGSKLTERDGVTSAFFDFKSDLGLASPTGVSKAISVNITIVAEDTATPPAWVAIDVIAGFTEGDVRGHMYAAYCPSLSQ